MSSVLESTVTTFPLERPLLRGRRREIGGLLPYFICGEENQLLSFVCRSDASVFQLGNPVLLVGPAGIGKTSIALHVAAREATQRSLSHDPNAVKYFAAVDFARAYAEAISSEDLAPYRAEVDDAEILIVDDLHSINDKGPAQDELATRIDARMSLRRPTILTCRRLPSEIRRMRPMLVSRSLPGLTIPIQPPAGEARQLILREAAQHHDVPLDNEWLDLLDRGLSDRLSARSLESAIKKISLWTRMNDCPPNAKAIDSAIESNQSRR